MAEDPKAASGSQEPVESKNVFTELFGKEGATTSPLAQNVLAQKEKGRSFFGSSPKQESELSLKTLREHPRKPGAAVLKASVLILIFTVAGFLTQNSTRFSFFGVNPALRVQQAEEQVLELSARVLVQNHLEAALLLDQYLSKTDEYFYALSQLQSQYTSENKKAEYQLQVEEMKPELIDLLSQVQEDFLKEMSPELLAASQQEVDTQLTALHEQAGTVDETILVQEIQDLETAKNLMTQNAFKLSVLALDLEKMTGEDFEAVYTQFSEVNASITALIGKIKNARFEWSFYLDQLERLTKTVDPLFGTEFAGSLSLDELRFTSMGTVTLTGTTVTDDSKNFTLVSDLIDAYEKSEYFKDVFDRSYNKNSENEAYLGSFRISLTLEQ
ncbi:MAG: hypothetical protein WC777_00925 [Candidatus Gracilibacteria bacterium]|jgi:hypothetical protein